MLDGGRKRDKNQNPASHAADIQRRDKDTRHVNREEPGRLLNQTVVLTELTELQLSPSGAEQRREVAPERENRKTGGSALTEIDIDSLLSRSERLNFLRLRKGRQRRRSNASKILRGVTS